MKLAKYRTQMYINNQPVNGVFNLESRDIFVMSVNDTSVEVINHSSFYMDGTTWFVDHDGTKFEVDGVTYLLEDLNPEFVLIAGENARKLFELATMFA